MKRRERNVTMLAIGLWLLAAMAAHADQFDLANDFSFSANPHGVWTLGALGATLDPASFDAFTTFTLDVASGATWHPAAAALPAIGTFNLTSFDTLTLVPSDVPAAERATVLFTAPYAGHFAFAGRFEAQDAASSGTTSDFAIQDSAGAIILAGPITYYPAPPSPNPDHERAFSFALNLAQGQRLYFSVGNGPDTAANDSTGLQLLVTGASLCDFNPGVPRIDGAALPYTTSLDTSGNTDSIEAPFTLDPGAPDAFWRFQPDQTGLYAFVLRGFATAFTVATGSCCDSTTVVGGTAAYDAGQIVYAPLTAGTDYLLIADGAEPWSFGPLTFQVGGPLGRTANDTCAGAFAIPPASLPFSQWIDTTYNTNTYDLPYVLQEGGGGAPDAWWTFTPAVSGLYEIGIESLGADLALGVFTGDCGALQLLDQEDVHYGGEQTVLPLQAGVTYHILADGYEATDVGYVRLRLRGPGQPTPNATLAGATVIDPAALPYNDALDTTFNPSTVDTGLAVSEGGGGGPDAWWRFTPTVSGRYIFHVASDAPAVYDAHDFVMGLYTGPDDNRTTVSEVESMAVTDAAVVLPADLTAGTTYTLLVEGFSPTDFGSLRLFVDGPLVAGRHDTCADPIVIDPSRLPFRMTVDNTNNANTLHSSATGPGSGPDVLFSLTPRYSGYYTFAVRGDLTDAGALLDQAVAVFSGACGNLTEVAAANNLGDTSFAVERTRALLTAGQTYTILVEGASPVDTGPMELRVAGPFFPTTNDTCEARAGVTDWTSYR